MPTRIALLRPENQILFLPLSSSITHPCLGSVPRLSTPIHVAHASTTALHLTPFHVAPPSKKGSICLRVPSLTHPFISSFASSPHLSHVVFQVSPNSHPLYCWQRPSRLDSIQTKVRMDLCRLRWPYSIASCRHRSAQLENLD